MFIETLSKTLLCECPKITFICYHLFIPKKIVSNSQELFSSPFIAKYNGLCTVQAEQTQLAD